MAGTFIDMSFSDFIKSSKENIPKLSLRATLSYPKDPPIVPYGIVY